MAHFCPVMSYPIFLSPWQQKKERDRVRVCLFQPVSEASCFLFVLPFLKVPVGCLAGRELDNENAGLSVLQSVLVVRRLGRTLRVQHKDLPRKHDVIPHKFDVMGVLVPGSLRS